MSYEKKFIATNHTLLDDYPSLHKNKIQFAIRSWLSKTFNIWDIWDILPSGWKYRYFDYIRPFFSPENKRIRKAVPRTWRDVSSLIVDINFEFVKAFYEDEFIDGPVNWDATEPHQEFASWLTKTYNYITIERPQLEKDMDNAYPPTRALKDMFKKSEKYPDMFEMVEDDIPYMVKYAEVNRLEKLIDDTDTEVLTEIVKRRHYFWT
jgi:hypothetical protein